VMLSWNEVTPVQQVGLGEFVLARRKELGMSQEALAEAADVGQKKISQMEASANFRSPIPPPDIVASVARVLRVTEMEILRAAGYLTDSPAAKRLDDAGDEYLADMDRLAQERGQAWMDRLDERIRTVIAEEVAPPPPKRTEQTTFGGI
jgi:transcriptional regulator with XRE-family HTH domain